MIIWINGAFGAGKTTVAAILNERMDNSYLYDPENVGDLLRRNLPKEIQKADFQDHTEWWAWNLYLLKKIDLEYNGDIIVPMTLYKQPAWQELLTGLQAAEIDVRHFQLEVSKMAILKRLEEREPAIAAWGAERVDTILAAFQQVPRTEKIANEEASPASAAQAILTRLYG